MAVRVKDDYGGLYSLLVIVSAGKQLTSIRAFTCSWLFLNPTSMTHSGDFACDRQSHFLHVNISLRTNVPCQPAGLCIISWLEAYICQYQNGEYEMDNDWLI